MPQQPDLLQDSALGDFGFHEFRKLGLAVTFFSGQPKFDGNPSSGKSSSM
jgi:hypothetical protein